jgi:hypothetical protein
MEVTHMDKESLNQNTQQELENVTEAGTPENAYCTQTPPPQRTFMIQEPENVPMGILGALLFSLVGGVLYFIIYQLGFIAGIAGFVSVICAVKGYKWLGKRESVKGVIISVIISVAVIFLAAIYSIGFECLDAMRSFYPSESINLINSPIYVLRMIKDSEDIMLAVISELGMALLLCIIAAGSSVVNAIKSAKANNK